MSRKALARCFAIAKAGVQFDETHQFSADQWQRYVRGSINELQMVHEFDFIKVDAPIGMLSKPKSLQLAASPAMQPKLMQI